VPFADELSPVVLVPHRDTWASDFLVIASSLRDLDLADEGVIEHVGSTAVAGLMAKDVIDVQIRLWEIDEDFVVHRFESADYRRRPESWNNVEVTRSGPEMKLVFAPAIGARRSNVHVRRHGSRGARDTLLFRDFLKANEAQRDAWDAFKRSILEGGEEVDLMTYGQAKQPAWKSLMSRADDWEQQQMWEPDPLVKWSRR